MNKDHQVQKLLESFKWQCNQKINQRKWPIILPILKRLCYAIKTTFKDEFYQRLYLALFITTYFGLFCFVEVIQDQRRERTIPIQAPDVTITESQVHIILRASKTTDAPALVILQARDDFICPLQAMRCYLVARGDHTGVLFTDRNKCPMPWGTVTRHFEKLLHMSHLPLDKFSFHGFHVGRVTQMFEEGTTAEEIQWAGQWKSEAFQVYLRPLDPTIKQCILENLDLEKFEKIRETQATTKAANRVLQSYKKHPHKFNKAVKRPILLKPPNHQATTIAPRSSQPIWGSEIEVINVPDVEFWSSSTMEITPNIAEITTGTTIQVQEIAQVITSSPIIICKMPAPKIKKKKKIKATPSQTIKIPIKVIQPLNKKKAIPFRRKVKVKSKSLLNKISRETPKEHSIKAVKVDHTYTNKISENKQTSILTKQQALQISAIFSVLPAEYEEEWAENQWVAAELPDSDIEIPAAEISDSDVEIDVVSECTVPQLQPQVRQPIMKKGKEKYDCRKLPNHKKNKQNNNSATAVTTTKLDGESETSLPQ